MESQYCEDIVKNDNSLIFNILKVVSLIGLIAVVLFASLFNTITLILLIIVMIGLFVFFCGEASKEYEYVYVDGDISFDVIYNKSRRKNKAATKWEETKIVCNSSAPQLTGYIKKNPKVINLSFSKPGKADVYAIITEKEGNYAIIYFKPSEDMLDMMIKKSPEQIIK